MAASISVITAAHASYKDDRVVLRNGDYLTGEVKKVERGKLEEFGFPGFIAGFFTRGIPRLERWK